MFKVQMSTKNQLKALSLSILIVSLTASVEAKANTYTFNYNLPVPGNNAPGDLTRNPNGYYDFATAINNNNTVAGYYTDGNKQAAFVNRQSLSYGIKTNIGELGSTNITGINNANAIVGNYTSITGIETGFYSITTSKNPTTILSDNNNYGSQVTSTLAGGINDNGIVVGWDTLADGSNYIYTNNINTNTYNDLSVAIAGVTGITNQEGLAINNNGWIVGDYTDANSVEHGFVYNGTAWTSIDDPNAVGGSTVATGINNQGEVVGWYTDASGATHGYSYDANTNTFINSQIDDPNSNGGTQVLGVNDNGVLVGWNLDTDTSFTTAPVVSSVPMPAAAWLWLTALTWFGLLSRMKIIRFV